MIARLRLAWRAALLLGTWLAPAVAIACPACAAREGGTSLRTYVVLASMILVPFAVAGVVIQIIRRLEKDGPG